VHAIAHQFGGKYHTPHGLANAIMLPLVLKYSLPAVTDRLALLAVRAKLGRESEGEDVLAQKFLDAVEQLNRDLGIPTFLAALKESDIPQLAEAACREAHTGYPVPRYMTQAVCEDLIRQVLPPRKPRRHRKPAPAKKPARRARSRVCWSTRSGSRVDGPIKQTRIDVMKKVVTVTLGSSKKDFEFKTKFLGQEFQVRRFGADKDSSKAWELMRRQQANADAIALSDMPDHYHVGLRTVINKKSQHLMQVVTRVPVTTGASLRRLLQVRAVRYVQKELGHYFNNNLVLFLSGMRNYDMAVALSDYTKNLSFADPVFHAASPVLLGSLDQLELFAKGKELLPDVVPGDFLKSVLGTLKNKIVANAVAKSHVIVGTFREIQAVASGGNLEGKTLITSAVDDEAFAFFARHKVNLAVDVTPKLFDRVVGISTITAMILAATGKSESELTDHDFEEITP
jgi:hypothetical protein